MTVFIFFYKYNIIREMWKSENSKMGIQRYYLLAVQAEVGVIRKDLQFGPNPNFILFN